MFKIIINGQYATVYTPYNPDFVSRVKQIGGAKWNPEARAWRISSDMVEAARAIMRDVYGCDDQPVQSDELVTVRLTCTTELSSLKSPVVVWSKVLAIASGRDSGAHTGDGVALLSGRVTSTGSVKNWRSAVLAGSVLLLTNVPKSILDQEALPDGCTAEIVETGDKRQKLLDEKARLESRLAEIALELETAQKGA